MHNEAFVHIVTKPSSIFWNLEYSVIWNILEYGICWNMENCEITPFKIFPKYIHHLKKK